MQLHSHLYIPRFGAFSTFGSNAARVQNMCVPARAIGSRFISRLLSTFFWSKFTWTSNSHGQQRNWNLSALILITHIRATKFVFFSLFLFRCNRLYLNSDTKKSANKIRIGIRELMMCLIVCVVHSFFVFVLGFQNEKKTVVIHQLYDCSTLNSFHHIFFAHWIGNRLCEFSYYRRIFYFHHCLSNRKWKKLNN